MKEQNRPWTCALTGHRELPEDFDKNGLCDKLELFLQNGCDRFLCGMAQGFDLEALDCLIPLRRKYRFTVEACIPYAGQGERLSAAARKRYGELLEFCDKKTVLFESYREGCFLARNRYMVDNADALLAYCKREKGGSAYTVAYAVKKGKPVVFLV